MKALLLLPLVLLTGWWWVTPPIRQEQPDRAPLLPEGWSSKERDAVLALSPLPPPPPDPTNRFADDPRAARFGQFLFFDARLSADGSVSCASCHDPTRGWSDGRSLPTGMGPVPRHAMGLANVAHNRWFLWDGRADSLWAQALQPIEDLREHGFSRLELAHLLVQDADLRNAYEQIFGSLPDLSDASRFPAHGSPRPATPDHPHHRSWSGVTTGDRETIDRIFSNVGKALAAFQRRIRSSGSRFDQFVEGVRSHDEALLGALSASEIRGLRLFVGDARCVTCHSGPNFTDREFHDNRVPPLGGGTTRSDPGRHAGIALVTRDPFNGVGAFSDAPEGPARDKLDYLVQRAHNLYEVKTPSLREVSRTAPYMHQGQFASLEEVLQYYDTLEGAAWSHHSETILQPLRMTREQLADLAAFLRSLEGRALDPELLKQPAHPF